MSIPADIPVTHLMRPQATTSNPLGQQVTAANWPQQPRMAIVFEPRDSAETNTSSYGGRTVTRQNMYTYDDVYGKADRVKIDGQTWDVDGDIEKWRSGPLECYVVPLRKVSDGAT